MKNVNDMMQEVLTADRLKLEDEIEDLQSDLSLFTIVLDLLDLCDHRGNKLAFAFMGDDISFIQLKRDRLREQLKVKQDEHKRICERLEEYE